jgi:fructosamine-3-kinase
VHEKLDRLLAHGDQPRLVHWDIWNTNILAQTNGDGKYHIAALLDPNCKFAHAEAEIAYMELFHTITPPFMKAYQHQHKLPAEYHKVRRSPALLDDQSRPVVRTDISETVGCCG